MLPVDLEIEWKNRLLKTAGFCIQENIDDRREAHIELASKVADKANKTHPEIPPVSPENYRKVKRRNKELSSSEIMKQLSEEFARKNKSKGDGKGDNFRKQKKRKRSEELSGGDVTVGLRSQAGGSEVEIEVDSSEDDFA
nr:hypothetical protein BaRGS_013839 [Batillaria attramentaria]